MGITKEAWEYTVVAMAVPDYESVMLPLLQLAGDKQTHRISEVIERLAKEFNLSTDDRKDLLPSGLQNKFDNRVSWARTYMKKAGLLCQPERGTIQITERGLQVLESRPKQINRQYLNKFPEFLEFQRPGKKPITVSDEPVGTEKTPEELLEESYSELYEGIASELLEKVKSGSPQFFETLVIDLLVKMGYGGSRKDAGEAIGRSKDGGIDGIIKEDKLGMDVIYIQAKRWENTVGRPVVQAFAGSLEGMRAKKGVLITTSQFSADAIEYVERIEKKIVLIDGDMLAKLMIDHNVGVSTVSTYEIKKIDFDYFEED
ncbi:MAG: restriction endonuclease [Candidatus Zixiibacteriota bacterium]